jgi:alpha-glucosidase
LPWESDAPGLGFGPTGKTWLPQPDSYAELARDRQAGVEGSTLEMYQAALALRRAFKLGAGSLEWGVDRGADVVAYTNGEVTVVANMGTTAVPLPAGEVLMASSELTRDGMLPPDVTAWLV